MRFRMNFGIVKTILLAIVALGALAIVALDIAMLVGTQSLAVRGASDTAIASVSLCAGVIIALGAVLILFNSAYTFKDKYMVAVMGVFVDKIGYDEMVCFKQNSLTKELYLITKGIKATDGEISFRLNLAPQNVDDFIAQTRQHKGNIIVDVFTPEKKDKETK